MLINLLNDYLQQINININKTLQESLISYWDFLLYKNNSLNLISRQGSLEFRLINHLVDSLTPLLVSWPDNLKVMDFGSGAGLPGIPLKICNPTWDITLVESKLKKANFLSETCNYLNLNNYHIIHQHLTNKYNINNIKFNLITVRAVSSINSLISNLYPFIKKDGILLIFKGPRYYLELNNTAFYVKKYNFELYKKINLKLPVIGSERNILFLRKL
jgi:16S rRNA (guanine527-N7)-methyltransferase